MADPKKAKEEPVEEPEVMATAEDNGQGAIRISEDVIIAVVRKYALSVPGVARLGGQSLMGGLANILGKRISDRSIIVEMEEESVNLTVTIVITFGEHVPTVASNVQGVCRKYVEELTGQVVGKVNIAVQGLETEDEQPADVANTEA